MDRIAFNTEKAAQPGGPYSQAIIHNGLVYLSGQGAFDPKTNQVRPDTIEEETKLTLRNIQIILEEAGSALDKVLQVTVYLRDIKEYSRFNDSYKCYFPHDPPARTCIQAGKLPLGVRVAIDLIAHI